MTNNDNLEQLKLFRMSTHALDKMVRGHSFTRPLTRISVQLEAGMAENYELEPRCLKIIESLVCLMSPSNLDAFHPSVLQMVALEVVGSSYAFDPSSPLCRINITKCSMDVIGRIKNLTKLRSLAFATPEGSSSSSAIRCIGSLLLANHSANLYSLHMDEDSEIIKVTEESLCAGEEKLDFSSLRTLCLTGVDQSIWQNTNHTVFPQLKHLIVHKKVSHITHTSFIKNLKTVINNGLQSLQMKVNVTWDDFFFQGILGNFFPRLVPCFWCKDTKKWPIRFKSGSGCRKKQKSRFERPASEASQLVPISSFTVSF